MILDDCAVQASIHSTWLGTTNQHDPECSNQGLLWQINQRYVKCPFSRILLLLESGSQRNYPMRLEIPAKINFHGRWSISRG